MMMKKRRGVLGCRGCLAMMSSFCGFLRIAMGLALNMIVVNGRSVKSTLMFDVLPPIIPCRHKPDFSSPFVLGGSSSVMSKSRFRPISDFQPFTFHHKLSS